MKVTDVTSLPLVVRVELEDNYYGYWPHLDEIRPSWPQIVEFVAERHGVDPQLALAYMVRFNKVWTKRQPVSIFVYRRAWERREPCVDTRAHVQYTPLHTFAIGFIAGNRALLHRPMMLTEEQCNQMRETLIEAIATAGEMHAEKKTDELLASGYAEIKPYCGLPKLYRSDQSVSDRCTIYEMISGRSSGT